MNIKELIEFIWLLIAAPYYFIKELGREPNAGHMSGLHHFLCIGGLFILTILHIIVYIGFVMYIIFK